MMYYVAKMVRVFQTTLSSVTLFSGEIQDWCVNTRNSGGIDLDNESQLCTLPFLTSGIRSNLSPALYLNSIPVSVFTWLYPSVSCVTRIYASVHFAFSPSTSLSFFLSHYSLPSNFLLCPISLYAPPNVSRNMYISCIINLCSLLPSSLHPTPSLSIPLPLPLTTIPLTLPPPPSHTTTSFSFVLTDLNERWSSEPFAPLQMDISRDCIF